MQAGAIRPAHLVFSLVFAIATAFAATSANAQAYPSRPIKLVVPYAAGGGSDVIARIFADRLSQRLKQSIIVENRAGAGGNIGADAVAKSDPDGYTILFTPQGPISIAQSLTPPPPYSAEKDLIPIAMLVWQPVLLVVNKNVPADDLKAFIELAKKQPGKLNFGSAGLGTEMHLTGELLKIESDIDIVHVPYRGGGPAINGLLTGEIEMMVVVTSSIAPHIQSGAVKALATTAPSRLDSYPAIRTTKEYGLGAVDTMPWWGIFVPAGTPPDIVEKLQNEALALKDDPEYSKKLANLSVEIANIPGAKFSDMLREERARWAKVIAASRVKLK
jgi:tripartite-type tricarboxylate transporter receptor subunit TctC